MGTKKAVLETEKAGSRVIGIAGCGHGVGCTHFSIMLLNYLTGFQRRRSALLEFDRSGNLERLEKVCTGKVREEKHFRILDGDYYKNAGPGEFGAAFQIKYEDILIDFGSVWEGDIGEFWRCEKRFLVGSFSEWQQDCFREFELGMKTDGKKSWQSLAVFGSEETRREFARRYRIHTERIPFSADAFAVTEECRKFFKRLI